MSSLFHERLSVYLFIQKQTIFSCGNFAMNAEQCPRKILYFIRQIQDLLTY